MGDIKQVIVVRKDLKNSKEEKVRSGKLISQGAHASVKVLVDRGEVFEIENKFFMLIPLTDLMRDWLLNRFTKITVSVDSEQELLDIYEKAKSAGIPCALITDAGVTEFNGIATNTCIAIGPALSSDIDNITGHLKLF